MKQYRIVSEGYKHYVEVGSPVSAYWYGTEPPIQWHRLSSFHTYLEAQQYLSFIQRNQPTYSEPFGWFK